MNMQMNAHMQVPHSHSEIPIQEYPTSQSHHQNGHQHGPQCRHGQQSIFQNPFSMVPPDMRFFVWHSLFSGDFIFRMMMQLPMMGQFYSMIMGIQSLFIQPFAMLSNSLQDLMQSDNIITKFITGLGIYYFIIHGLIYYFMQDTLPEKNILLWLQLTITILVFLASGINPGSWQKKDFELNGEMIRYHMQFRNYCPLCEIPKVARSNHCIYCKKCVKKWEAHSMLLNTCIGVNNHFLYILLLGFISTYFFIFLRQFTLERGVEKSLFDLAIIIINLNQLYYFGQQFLLQLLKVFNYINQVSYNMTNNETYNWRRYSYMWKNIKGQFYNPFDQGVIQNWIQFIKPTFTSKGTYNWSNWQILNAADIPNHPLSEIVQEQVQEQIKQMRQKQRVENRDDDQTEEQRGLLE